MTSSATTTYGTSEAVETSKNSETCRSKVRSTRSKSFSSSDVVLRSSKRTYREAPAPALTIDEDEDVSKYTALEDPDLQVPKSPDSVAINIYDHGFDDTKEERIALVLDVDECLVHSRFLGLGNNDYRQNEDRPAVLHSYPDSFEIIMEDGERAIVNKRPGLDAFLHNASQLFDIYVFTAGLEIYGSAVIDKLDPTGKLFKGRLFRSDCMVKQGMFLKDLSVVRKDLSKVILVDNNPVSFLPQPRNGIPVPSFYDDFSDRTLEALWSILRTLDSSEDVRPRLASMFKLHELLAEHRQSIIGCAYDEDD